MDAQKKGYTVTLLYFWLDSPALAMQRVKKRVERGGHHIPDYNLFNLYLPICDRWFVFDNMDLVPEIIVQGHTLGKSIVNNELWIRLKAEYDGK